MRHAFKTPTLRNVDRRAPYMHDGSVATLDAVVDFYDRGGLVARAEPVARAQAARPDGRREAPARGVPAHADQLTDPAVAIPALPR